MSFELKLVFLFWKNMELHSNQNKKEFECQVSDYKIPALGFHLGGRDVYVIAHSTP